MNDVTLNAGLIIISSDYTIAEKQSIFKSNIDYFRKMKQKDWENLHTSLRVYYILKDTKYVRFEK